MLDTVQIADGTRVAPANRSNIDDCLSHRVPIGQGEIANLEILSILKDEGHMNSVGPEIFSEVLDAMTPEAIFESVQPGFEDILARL